MTDAPVDLDHLQSYCDAAARLPGATAIGVDSRELARLIAEVRAARSAPPADEVAGLVESLREIRDVAVGYSLKDGLPGTADAIKTEAGRIENHLKGKR